MLEQLTSAQLSEWEAYDRLDPIGNFRQDHNTALLLTTITNIANAIYHEEGAKPVVTTPADHMPVWDKEERKRLNIKREQEEVKKQNAEDMKSYLMAFSIEHNKRIEKKSKPPVKLKS